ncbi:MAG: lipocalin-like domain-containing protein [Pseudomonadota bacterium]
MPAVKMRAPNRSARALDRWPTAVWLVVLLAGFTLAGCGAARPDGGAEAPDTPHTTDTPEADVVASGLRVTAVLGESAAADGFERARTVREFAFPADHGAHPEFRSEWWYLTCPLRAAVGGAVEEAGVQFTLFRQGLRPGGGDGGWRSGQIFMAHVAVTDVAARVHRDASRFARGHPELAGVRAAPFAAWLEDWRLEAPPGTADLDVLELSFAQPARAGDAGFGARLRMEKAKPRVAQGDRGLSFKGGREASYYFSYPRLRAVGDVWQADRRLAVTGDCWFDREWSTSVLAPGLVGWDWFALQFDDGREFMLFQLRDGAGRAADTQGKAVAVDGVARSLKPDTIALEPLRRFGQGAGDTTAGWPVEWRVTIENQRFRIVAALDDQRMDGAVRYWEGLVHVYRDGREGSARERIGQGYLEMTGYDDE